MAAHVLRLRIALLFGALRGDAAHVARVVGALLLLLVATGAACWGLLTMRDAATDEVLAVTVLGGSAVTLGFALAPLFGSVDDPLDPRRFALFGLPRGRLAFVLAVAGQVLAEGTVAEVRGELTLEQRFVELAGGLSDVEGLEWLHTFSD